ncbi:MAG: ribose 5-phosphate isomerase B [Armatimonadetes bacterium]|nr:ribose 5-phosphate isomerase B [Armatimonadota bacterium]
MKIAIGSDHAGFELKESLKDYLEDQGLSVTDLGARGAEPSVDYPDFAALVADGVSNRTYEKGILVCGSGVGMEIVANKFPGVRAALCGSTESARLSREHNDANVLTLGGRTTGKADAIEIVKTWLSSQCTEERHLQRVRKIEEIERRNFYGSGPG